MNIFGKDDQERKNAYDNIQDQHYHESIDWSNNLFGESIPGADGDQVADDAGTDSGDTGAGSMANEGTDDTGGSEGEDEETAV